MEHIHFEDQSVGQGEKFEPVPGYRVTYVRNEGPRLILRDEHGEFTRPITPASPLGRRSAPLLGERRIVVETTGKQPSEEYSCYTLTYQICVPGGWQAVDTEECSTGENHAGVYGPLGQMIEDASLRRAAKRLGERAQKLVKRHAYTRLGELLTLVRLQDGGTGQPGGWDDPAVVMEIANLLESSHTL
ncbi:hypothetical protein ACFU99_05850 [Streptomyces sp. NPDC057654]|uniref:hypothetical protein n=1 Tax=Streptomyces sp. NPDC057654 TaxID=3346196 RepID=UPI0036AC728B